MARFAKASRRRLLTQAGGLGAVLIASGVIASPARAATTQRAVIVGGGFGGATAARFLKLAQPALQVTLVTEQPQYVACPFSNLVVAGRRELRAQYFNYDQIRASGVRVVIDRAVSVDANRRVVQLDEGTTLAYDRLILAPGIDLKWNAIDGYDAAAANTMPHAWQAGDQTRLLRDQLDAMPDGGLVIIAAPANPYRCPPGPYERASLIARFLKDHKPRSKLILLDAKDAFSKQALFQNAWRERYGDLIEWRGLSDGGRVIGVDRITKTVRTDFDAFRPAVANIVPPQQAGAIARLAGATDRSGWCPIDALTFESTLLPRVHVIGDAAIANAMPKSAFAANAQAKVCALQVARLLAGLPPLATTLANTCYSLIDENYAVSIAGVYRASGQQWVPVPGAGGTSPLAARARVRALEAGYARDWFNTITAETFG